MAVCVPVTIVFVLLGLWMPCVGCYMIPTATAPTCPQKCECSGAMTVFKCDFLSRPAMRELPATTKALFLKKDFIGPIFNQTFNHLVTLETLDLGHNGINFLQNGVFRNLINLKRLNLRGNLLEALDDNLFFDTLQLEYLDVSRNRLRVLPAAPFRFLPNLKQLNLSYNLLSSAKLGLRFQVTTKLQNIDFTGNDIPFFSAEDFAVMAGWESRAPKVVNLSRCNIVEIDADVMAVMKNIDFLSVAHNPDLEINNISAYLDVFQKVNLKRLDLSYTNLSFKLNASELTPVNMGLLSIKELNLAGNSFADIDNYTLTYLSLSKLDLSFNLLKAVVNGISGLSSLQHLDLSHNEISTVADSFSRNVGAMETLKLAHNLLHDDSNLLLTNAAELQYLDLSFNRFKSFQIPVELEKLKQLDMESNAIKSLNNGEILLGLRNLEEINLNNNSITSLPAFMFRDSSRINTATFACNEISSISHHTFVPHCPAVIDLSKNNLVTVHNYGWHNVESLDLSGNAISYVEPQSLFFLDSLHYLDLSHNYLEEMDEEVLSHLTNLVHVKLNNNFFNCSLLLPQILSPLHNLEIIDLGYNNFRKFEFLTLPFDKNTRIKQIKLAGNHLMHLNPSSFSSLDNLEAVDFSKNPFRCDCKALAIQSWISKTHVNLLGKERYGYMCKAPAFRNRNTLLNFKLRTFECNRYLYYVLVFSCAGGALMVFAITIAIICHLCRRRRRRQKEEEFLSTEGLLFKSSVVPNGKVANGNVLMNGDATAVRENYIQHSPSDTLIDVEFENPLILNDDLLSGGRKVNGRKEEKRTRNGRNKNNKSNGNRKKNKQNNIENGSYMKEVRFQHRNGSTSNKGSVSDAEIAVIKRAKSDADIRKKRLTPKQEYQEKKRRPRGNKDLIRLLSLRESRSMPDVISYINSLPRHESRSRRDYRYSRIPIVHIDHVDSSHNDWARSMVDLRRAQRSRDPNEARLVKYPHEKQGYSRLRHGRVPEKYNTISSSYKTVTMATRPIDPERDHEHIGFARANSVSDQLSEWV